MINEALYSGEGTGPTLPWATRSPRSLSSSHWSGQGIEGSKAFVALRGLRLFLVAICLFVSFLQSWFFAYALVPDPDGTVAIFLGRLALTGEISLFQDELPGHRVPLPYYFIGLSQILWPGSLVGARLFTAVLGLVCLLLVLLIATRLGGELCGILAFLFAVTQSVIIGYFAYASYHSVVSFFLLAGFYVMLCTSFRYNRVVAMSLFSLLFFSRTLVIPLIPLAMFYLLWKAKGLAERMGIVAVAVVPPAVFFLYDLSHLKLLAYVPLLRKFVLPLGFQASPTMTSAFPYEPGLGSDLTTALWLFARWYKVWILAALVLIAALAVRLVRGPTVREFFSNRGVNLIAVVTLYLALWQLVIFRGSWSWAVGYFPSFAILAAICLGFGFSVLIQYYCITSGRRAAILASLLGLFLVSPALSRPPTLPLAVSYEHPPTQALYNLAEALRTRIPHGSRVFTLGGTQALYMADLRPYLRQVFGFWTLSPIADERIRKRSGLWGEAEIREWLTKDAEYAVIVPSSLDAYRTSCNGCVELIESLLTRHFSQITVLDQYPGQVHVVYRRKSL